MFQCEQCHKNSKPREKQTRLVVETRIKYYDDGARGSEIVREIKVCAACTPQPAGG